MVFRRQPMWLIAWLATSVLTGLAIEPLDLEAFEDADCVSDAGSELLLELMAELCDVAESATTGGEDENIFRGWVLERGQLLVQLANSIFSKPYCEPGKVAGAIATCLLWLSQPIDESRLRQLSDCSRDVDSLLQNTAGGDTNIYDTRLHMFLRSPWPVFRLLDIYVRLHPSDSEVADQELGKCKAHEDLNGKTIEFDWPWFKQTFTNAVWHAAARQSAFLLNPNDGPLSDQYRQRWLRIYSTPGFREAAAFGSAVFYEYRRNQWEAGCNPAVVGAYIMQIISFSIRDSEAWLHRYVGASWRLLNLLSPLTSLALTDWSLFRALHVASLLRRHPSAWTPGRNEPPPLDPKAPWVAPSCAKTLQDMVRSVVSSRPQQTPTYVSAAWGVFSQFVQPFLTRWVAIGLPPLIFLAHDAEALSSCEEVSHKNGRADDIACIDLVRPLSVEASVAKYIALAEIALFGDLAVWVDLDVYLPRDPTALLEAALKSGAKSVPLALSTAATSRSLSPSIVVGKGSAASDILLGYATWLYEHPYILDHQGWDAFLRNPDGDFSGGWDYKGRNVSHVQGDGLQRSFAPGAPISGNQEPESMSSDSSPKYAILGPHFGSGDGLRVVPAALASFHFWGASETQRDLFSIFYPFEAVGFMPAAKAVLSQYLLNPFSLSVTSAEARNTGELHLTAITYAHGCCEKSVERNRRTAMEVGIDEAHAYGLQDLEKGWVAKHSEILKKRTGAGWWLWKPYLILRTLRNASVPWDTGVVLWLDAGNYYTNDPRPTVEQALRNTDVAAMRLKCCIECDWTSVKALQKLGGDIYSISDMPQLGAYFIIMRKTTTTIAFVEKWLRLAEDPEILLESGGTANMRASPGFQRHMADQSIFSVLFKQHGFEALSLVEGHRAVQLDRWRE